MKFNTLLMIIGLGIAPTSLLCFNFKTTPRPLTAREAIGGVLLAPLSFPQAAHEYSHAAAAWSLNDEPINVHLGVVPANYPALNHLHSQHLFQANGLTVHSLLPIGGYAVIGSSSDEKVQAAMLAAGPLGGASTAAAELAGMSWLTKSINKSNMSQMAKVAAKTPIRFYGKPLAGLALLENVANGTPVFGEISDGYEVARLAGVPKEKLDNCKIL